MEEKKRLFSGIQPSGTITLGNYIGALSNFVNLQEEYDSIFCVVDLHSITVRQDPAVLRKRTLELLALYIASGLDPHKATLFIQSHVPAHVELAWVLNTLTYIGELSRMTQFKDKSRKQENNNINAGLLNYPVLMAADILLYQSSVVPIGIDQKQHLELTRDIAIRFNSQYSETFVVPDAYIPKVGAKIMSLVDPTSKMSKSDSNENGFIKMDDDKDAIIRKFRRATTDSDNQIIASADKPGISNLLAIYSFFRKKSIQECEKELNGVSYKDFKEMVGESVYAGISPIQQRQKEILKDTEYLNKVILSGSEKANYMARKTLSKVYRKVGFILPGKL